MIKGFNRIMIVSKLTKLLTVSLIGVIFSNTGFSEFLTQNTKCLKPVQIFGALSIGGQKGKTNVKVDNKAVVGKLQETKVMTTDGKFPDIKEVNSKGVKIKKGETSEATSDGNNVKVITHTYDNTGNNTIDWEPANDVTIKATSNVSDVQTKDEKQFVTVTTKNTFAGNSDQVFPVKGNDAAVTTAVNNANNNIFPDLTQSETSTQNIYLSVDPSTLTKYGFDNPELYKFIQQFSEKNALPGSISGLNGVILVELGLITNLPGGGAIAISGGAKWTVVNKTQKFELGKDGASSSTSESESNNSTNNSSTVNGWLGDLIHKYAVFLTVELIVPLSDKFSMKMGCGIEHNKYESRISSNKESDSGSNNQENKNYFLKQQQDMTGLCPFIKAGFDYFFNNNIGVGVFGKYYCPHVLKETDTKSSDESSNTSSTNNNGFPLSFTKSAWEFGASFLFKF